MSSLYAERSERRSVRFVMPPSLVLLSLAACGDDAGLPLPGTPFFDAGPRMADLGTMLPVDGGPSGAIDSGMPEDASVLGDLGGLDLGETDLSEVDLGVFDGGAADVGIGMGDLGFSDASANDGGSADGGGTDVGLGDGGLGDTGPGDTGPGDAGVPTMASCVAPCTLRLGDVQLEVPVGEATGETVGLRRIGPLPPIVDINYLTSGLEISSTSTSPFSGTLTFLNLTTPTVAGHFEALVSRTSTTVSRRLATWDATTRSVTVPIYGAETVALGFSAWNTPARCTTPRTVRGNLDINSPFAATAAQDVIDVTGTVTIRDSARQVRLPCLVRVQGGVNITGSRLEQVELPNLRSAGSLFIDTANREKQVDLPRLSLAGNINIQVTTRSRVSMPRLLGANDLRLAGDSNTSAGQVSLRDINYLRRLRFEGLVDTGSDAFGELEIVVNGIQGQGNPIRPALLPDLLMPRLQVLPGLSMIYAFTTTVSAPHVRSTTFNMSLFNSGAYAVRFPGVQEARQVAMQNNLLPMNELDLSGLEYVGAFSLQQARLAQISLPRLDEVDNGLGLAGGLMQSVSMPVLRRVGNLSIQRAAGLNSLNMPLLGIVERNFELRQVGTSTVSPISMDLGGLTNVDASVSIVGNPGLTSLSGLSRLANTINLTVTFNANLPTCQAVALRNRMTISGRSQISNNLPDNCTP